MYKHYCELPHFLIAPPNKNWSLFTLPRNGAALSSFDLLGCHNNEAVAVPGLSLKDSFHYQNSYEEVQLPSWKGCIEREKEGRARGGDGESSSGLLDVPVLITEASQRSMVPSWIFLYSQVRVH